MASTTPAKKTASSTTKKTASTTKKAAAPKYRAEKKGQHVHVFDGDKRVALLHHRDADLWATAEHGKTLRKYVELELDDRVRNWAPLDTKTHRAVFAAAAKVVAAEQKAAAK